MTTITYFTTPSGDELAVLPRRELEALREAADHGRALADYRAGRVPGLGMEDARMLVEAATPLAFWRKFRGLTQTALAHKAGVTQSYLSEVEAGKKAGDIALWVRLSRELDLPVEELVDVED